MGDKKRNKLKTIVLDYDDTVVDFLGGLCRIHNKRYNTCISANDIQDWDFSSLEVKDARGNVVKGSELKKTFIAYEDDGLYVGLEMLGDADFALELMKKLGYKVIILTARDEKFGKQTELNLIFNRIAQYVDEVYFKADKVKKIKDLSRTHHIVLFADDKASTVQAVAEECTVDNIFLIEKPHNKNIECDESVMRVRDLLDTVRYLKECK